MYVKGLGVLNTATGIALLPGATNHLIFVIAGSMLASGVVILTASAIVDRLAKRREA